MAKRIHSETEPKHVLEKRFNAIVRGFSEGRDEEAVIRALDRSICNLEELGKAENLRRNQIAFDWFCNTLTVAVSKYKWDIMNDRADGFERFCQTMIPPFCAASYEIRLMFAVSF